MNAKQAVLATLLDDFEAAVRQHQEERRGPDRDYAIDAKKEVERLRAQILKLVK